MRIYHFGNFYMSSIQQGIQAAHCQMEMFLKYNAKGANQDSKKMLYEWARYHKTMICLNAGANAELHDIRTLFEREDNTLPWSYFYEEQDAMAGMLTNVAIIVPEKIYGQRKRLTDFETILYNGKEYEYTEYTNAIGKPISKIRYDFSEFEQELFNVINSCRLAN